MESGQQLNEKSEAAHLKDAGRHAMKNHQQPLRAQSKECCSTMCRAAQGWGWGWDGVSKVIGGDHKRNCQNRLQLCQKK